MNHIGGNIKQNRNVQIQNIYNNQNQRIRQYQNLEQYCLYITYIQGDGNLLVSEDQHYALRVVAVDHIRQNSDV